jgi:hypothetical protein
MSFWTIARWLSRLPLVVAVIFFLFLAGQWLVAPTGVSVITDSGIKLDSAGAVTNMRGTGALFVPLAAILVVCLVSQSRVLLGLRLLTTLAAGGFVVRCGILVFDGATPLLLRILRFELILIAFATAGLVLETVRVRRQRRPGHEAARRSVRRWWRAQRTGGPQDQNVV